jgi:hypothetical protein
VILGAVLVPSPLLLLPGYVGASDPIAELRGAAQAAVAALVSTGRGEAGGRARSGPDEVVIVGGTDGYASSPEITAPEHSLSIRVGQLLLSEVGNDLPVTIQPIGYDAPADRAIALGVQLAARPGLTALLVVGDGSARHLPSGPGTLDERAAPFEEVVVDALREGDAATLRGIDTELADELMVAGRAAWQVLAGALPDAAGAVHWTGAPFGVAYHVASWSPR